MELHSYAKRRTLKKWTVEQKRKLVETRIAHDAWFVKKPSSSVVAWKNILIAANLIDFNVFFVRKQWNNMLARYKQYKQTRLGNSIDFKAIDNELIKRINQEWEFFEPIHKFMSRKTTNLHSYALTHRTESNNSVKPEIQQPVDIKGEELSNKQITISLPKNSVKENIPINKRIRIQSRNMSGDEGLHLFSSDTSNDFEMNAGPKASVNEEENLNSVRNTDHDCYSKRTSLEDIADLVKLNEGDALQEQQLNYFADASEESQESLNMIVDLLQILNSTHGANPVNANVTNDSEIPTNEIKSENPPCCESSAPLDLKKEIPDQEFLDDMPSTSKPTDISQQSKNAGKYTKPQLSERDKYYRHKRRYNRRLERRFDAILQVTGRVIKTVYPTVDVTPLENSITLLTTGMNKLLSSDSDDDNQSDDSSKNIPKGK